MLSCRRTTSGGTELANTHLDALRSLLERAGPGAGEDVAIECKHFFGGAAAYADGRIFMSLTKVGLALKLPEGSRADLMRGGATPLRYFPKGPIKKDYVAVPKTLTEDEGALSLRIREAIAYARSAPKGGKSD